MQIQLFSSTGAKTKMLDLPANLFEANINWGLMHQAVVRQQNNRRQGSSAHVKNRGEVQGSTRKIVAQKHTGGARHGPIRGPTLRGGGKIFGPRNDRNFVTEMPKKMRHAALRSCLAAQATKGTIIGLESYPETSKTKQMAELLKKLPVDYGRKILFVTEAGNKSIHISGRNIPGMKTITANYLNPEDILNARHVIFLVEGLKQAEELFGASKKPSTKVKAKEPKKTVSKLGKKPAAKRTYKRATEAKEKAKASPSSSKKKASKASSSESSASSK